MSLARLSAAPWLAAALVLSLTLPAVAAEKLWVYVGTYTGKESKGIYRCEFDPDGGKLTAPAPDSVAEHDLVSEVYHIIDGSATLVTGPDIVDEKRRPSTLQTVREFNGPGNSGSSIPNPVTYELRAGDVVVIPAGTGHWFTKIDDHIRYIMVRIDPDKVIPLKDAAASQTYLRSPVDQSKGKNKGN